MALLEQLHGLNDSPLESLGFQRVPLGLDCKNIRGRWFSSPKTPASLMVPEDGWWIKCFSGGLVLMILTISVANTFFCCLGCTGAIQEKIKHLIKVTH